MGLSDILKSMFGNKSSRDLKKITPIVNQIKAIYPEIDALDHDQLRQRTADIRQQLRDAVHFFQVQPGCLASPPGKNVFCSHHARASCSVLEQVCV